MTYFVIRHNATGLFMPQMIGAGYTHWNPGVKYRNEKSIPRLFSRRQDAQAAARWWTEGKWNMDFTTDWESGITEDLGPAVERGTARPPGSLTIIEVDLVIVQGELL